MTPQEVSLLLYNVSLLPIVIVSTIFLFLSIASMYVDKPRRYKSPDKLPSVTVQVPSYNDPVAARCIKACLKMDYPKDKLQIMVLDDSTLPKTQKLLYKLAQDNELEYYHRPNRRGYKPGALQEVMDKIRGEIVVIFDADFVPQKNFLQNIVAPFEDPKVAIVQGRQGFLNHKTNLVSRFAAYLLMIQHGILMPVNDKLNTVFFCGTGGAIRKKAIMEVGGWNPKSMCEDTELSIRILSKGYKTVYLPFETPSEVPTTIEAFIKQQVRWTFGNTRTFVDHAFKILLKRGLKLRQRLMITFLTLGNVVAPAVVIMTFAGLSGWFLGEPELFQLSHLLEFIIKFFYTIGFIVMAFAMLYKRRSLKEFPTMMLALLSLSIVLAAANTVALYKAFFQKDRPLFRNTNWEITPKDSNAQYDASFK